jgi:hypothetical protein
MIEPDCDGSGSFVELTGLTDRKSALCPLCDYVDQQPLDVVERNGKLIGRLRAHEVPPPTLAGTFEELGLPRPIKASERKP